MKSKSNLLHKQKQTKKLSSGFFRQIRKFKKEKDKLLNNGKMLSINIKQTLWARCIQNQNRKSNSVKIISKKEDSLELQRLTKSWNLKPLNRVNYKICLIWESMVNIFLSWKGRKLHTDLSKKPKIEILRKKLNNILNFYVWSQK